ncbi:hypothetical protein ACEWY4_018050 [Coilia grayii]|uniref:Centriole, cilia and spindle-associated protein n=1 Tax=Coilia grayii TaxID=363190 RepID=A0ABD1JLE8_9TELE
MTSNNKAAVRRVRSEYMKKFRDPKWDTFSKNYEDSVKYRVNRRVMEQTHKPLFWDGWDTGSESSGRSSPKLRDGSDPSINKLQTASDSRNETDDTQDTTGTVVVVNGQPADAHSTMGDTSAVENGVPCETDHHCSSSETVPKRRVRRRAPRSEPGYEGDIDKPRPSSAPKLSRAKSQPAEREQRGEKEGRRSYMRPGWTERHMETRGRTPSIRASVSAGEIHRSEAAAKRQDCQRWGGPGALDRRRARSADLEKTRKSQLSVADDRWMTEYMRCFSARLR